MHANNAITVQMLVMHSNKAIRVQW